MRRFLFGLTLSLLACAPLAAVPFSFSNIQGTFTDVQTNGPVTGVGTSQIHWGSYGSYSAFKFNDSSAVSGNEGDLLTIGQFVHENTPISVESITQATLSVNLSINIDGVIFQNRTFSFDIQHTETPNNTSNPDDIVTISQTNVSSLFFVNGTTYQVTLSGFYRWGNLTSGFTTPENDYRVAYFKGDISSVAVPEPSTYLLLGTTLCIALTYRQRQLQAQLAARKARVSKYAQAKRKPNFGTSPGLGQQSGPEWR